MVTRRDVLRGMSLAALAVATPGWLAGCGGSGPKEGGVNADTANLKLVSSDVERAAADPAAVASGVASINALGVGLYAELAGELGNLAISPYSVVTALGMGLNGARQDTLEEMLRVCSTESPESLNAGLNAVALHLDSLAGPVPHRRGDEIALASANGLFGQVGERWEQEFLDTLARWFGTGMHQVDYKGATEAARVAVNDWTSEQTRGRIEEIVPEGAIDDMTRLIAVNCLYFKAPWGLPFEPALTTDAPFRLEDGTTVTVPMMHGIQGTAYTGDGWTAVRLPFAGYELAMTLVLPDPGALAGVEAAVAAGRIADFLAVRGDLEAELAMPRWTFRTAAALKRPLTELGMPTAFDSERADFSGITTDEQLFVGDVLHQVFIAVDEHGAEAAASTAEIFQATSLPQTTPVVLDRPFLFVIHDIEHGTPLFVGRVADPSV